MNELLEKINIFYLADVLSPYDFLSEFENPIQKPNSTFRE